MNSLLLFLYVCGAASFGLVVLLDMMQRAEEARAFFRQEDPLALAVSFTIMSFLTWWYFGPLFLAEYVRKKWNK